VHARRLHQDGVEDGAQLRPVEVTLGLAVIQRNVQAFFRRAAGGDVDPGDVGGVNPRLPHGLQGVDALVAAHDAVAVFVDRDGCGHAIAVGRRPPGKRVRMFLDAGAQAAHPRLRDHARVVFHWRQCFEPHPPEPPPLRRCLFIRVSFRHIILESPDPLRR